MDITERRISRIARGASRFTSRVMRRQGVGSSELDLIFMVRHHPGITQADACRKMELDKGAVARLAARLEEKGYLRRETDEKDRRIKLLYATEKSDELRSSKAHIEEFFYEWLTEPLSDSEKQELARMLEILTERCRGEWHDDFANVTKLLDERGIAP